MPTVSGGRDGRQAALPVGASATIAGGRIAVVGRIPLVAPVAQTVQLEERSRGIGRPATAMTGGTIGIATTGGTIGIATTVVRLAMTAEGTVGAELGRTLGTTVAAMGSPAAAMTAAAMGSLAAATTDGVMGAPTIVAGGALTIGARDGPIAVATGRPSAGPIGATTDGMASPTGAEAAVVPIGGSASPHVPVGTMPRRRGPAAGRRRTDAMNGLARDGRTGETIAPVVDQIAAAVARTAAAAARIAVICGRAAGGTAGRRPVGIDPDPVASVGRLAPNAGPRIATAGRTGLAGRPARNRRTTARTTGAAAGWRLPMRAARHWSPPCRPGAPPRRRLKPD